MPDKDKPNDTLLGGVHLAVQNKSQNQKDPFWSQETIDSSRWSKVFPYQLLVVKQSKDSSGNATYTQDDLAKKFVFTLPFPPESLVETWPFASSLEVTQGGVVEEHNGIPKRSLTMSGSLGVLPLKGSAPVVPQANFAQGVFAGTIIAAGRVVNQLEQSSGFQPPNVVDDSSFDQRPDQDIAVGSGYHQMRLLKNFLEDYANLKKTLKGRPYRLAFAVWKQQAVHLVRAASAVFPQDASSPLEWRYSLQFEAWRRIKLSDQPGAFAQYEPVTRDANTYAQSLKAVQDARTILADLGDVAAALVQDVDSALFEPLREVALFMQDALAVPPTFAEMPARILADAQSAVVQYVGLAQRANGLGALTASASARTVEAYDNLAAYAAKTDVSTTQAAALADQGLGRQDLGSQTPDDAIDPFRNPSEYFEFFSSIKPSQVRLQPRTIKAINAERDRVRSLNRLDFERLRDSLTQFQADFADAVGAGDATYNATYGRPAPSFPRQPTAADFRVMFAVNRAATEVGRLAASQQTSQAQPNPLDFVAGLHSRSGIAFTVPVSKYAVPFPYGWTLERLAQTYLGDPDRWGEIVALNGLREPFVDEEGFDSPLLAPGNGNEVVVAPSPNFRVGQQIWLSANDTVRTARRVQKLRQLSAGVLVLTLDGDDDLDRFTVAQGASLHAFLPDTVNSQQTIYIPSSADPGFGDYQTKAIPGLSQLDQLAAVGGVDLLLTSTNDLVVTDDGDSRFAVGLTNVIQGARIALSVSRGTLLRHPTFGLDVEPGTSVADLDPQQLLKSAKELFADDPGGISVSSAGVTVAGPVAKLGIGISVRGFDGLIPATFEVER